MDMIKQLQEEIKLKKRELKTLQLIERVKNLKFNDLTCRKYMNNGYSVNQYEIRRNGAVVTGMRTRLCINDKKHQQLKELPYFQDAIVHLYKKLFYKKYKIES
jgi:hypothetical protein